MVTIAIWIVLILVVLGVLVIAVFGIRSLTYGNITTRSILIMGAPLLLLGILGLMPAFTWPQAAILTVLITLGAALVTLLGSGVMSMFR